MPTYDYACDSCGHRFEQFQSITAEASRKCPKCGKMSLRRLIGAGAGVIFKGSGFYQTDYRTDSYAKASKSEKTALDSSVASGKDTGGTAKKETKSDTCTEGKSDTAAKKKSA
jgi:putative FmdB family regulatory protein